MNSIVNYNGTTVTLNEFCKINRFNYEDIEFFAHQNDVTIEQAAMYYFPMMYINILGELVMPD